MTSEPDLPSTPWNGPLITLHNPYMLLILKAANLRIQLKRSRFYLFSFIFGRYSFFLLYWICTTGLNSGRVARLAAVCWCASSRSACWQSFPLETQEKFSLALLLKWRISLTRLCDAAVVSPLIMALVLFYQSCFRVRVYFKKKLDLVILKVLSTPNWQFSCILLEIYTLQRSCPSIPLLWLALSSPVYESSLTHSFFTANSLSVIGFFFASLRI